MGRNDNLDSEKILVKVDQNNLVYIDPNSTIDRDGQVYPRGVEHEKLVMYVNLEADLIPRSTFVAGNDQNTLTSIAKGTLNFLSNNGQDFNTNWTDAYVGTDVKVTSTGGTTNLFEVNNQNYDSTAQSFGIQSINITVKGAQFVPQVTINFVDVRGKTLFESPENSPYNAFFHIPWPIFYLTVKGFYGKAIKYRLHLVKFSTRYNDNNGNFEITTSFVGSTYAYLTDIPIKGALNAPYMYSIEAIKDEQIGNNTTTKKVVKLSRGYSLLKAVISEYINKGLLPKDFPVRTLRELGHIAQRLDKTLEEQIFKEVADTNFFAALKQFNDLITNFENETKAWAKVKLSDESKFENNVREYYLQTNRESFAVVTGMTSQGTLEFLISNYKQKISEAELFTNKVVNKSNSKFNYLNIGWNTVGSISDYARGVDKKVLIKIDTLIEDIQKIRTNFNQQQQVLFNEIEQKMNNIVRSKDNGIGFEPTVRNIFGIILANAEVYVRLMKDVHRRAFDVSEDRKKVLSGFTKDSKFESIFPWPEIKKGSDGDKSKVIAYPGDVDLQSKLESYNKRLWPEVEFVEDFIAVSTNKIDTNSEKENGSADVTNVYEPDIEEKKLKKISSLFNVNTTIPYLDKSNTSVLYEIWERSNYITLFDSFNVKTIKELANFEFQNIQEILQNDVDIIGILYNNVTGTTALENLLSRTSPYERYPDKEDNLPTVEYIKDLLDFNFKIEQYIKPDSTSPPDSAYDFINENLNNYEPESYRLNIYPFTSPTYLSYLKKDSLDLNYLKPKNLLSINQKEGFIISPIDTKIWVKSAYTDNLFSQYFKNDISGGTKVNALTETSILNTPYFHKQLYTDFNKTSNFGKYAGSAYLFLNSLPYKDLEDTISLSLTSDKEVPMSSLIKEIGATHYIPYYLLLKWGSIYHRYKKFVLYDNDILTGFTTSNFNTTTTNIPGSTFFNNNETGATFTAFTVNTTGITYSNNVDVGVHPFYDAIYHQIINGYNHYVVSSGDTSFSSAVSLNAIKIKPSTINGINFWTQFVDNSAYSGSSQDLRYTILPCDGDNKYKRRILNSSGTEQISNKDFFTEEQFNFRCIWSDEIISNDFSGVTFSNPYQYNRTLVTGSTGEDNEYAIGNDYRRVIDLIGTFSPKLLEQFEDMFLHFASENIQEELSTKRFPNVRYYKFQEILKDILTVTKESEDSSLSIDDLIIKIKERQKTNLETVTKNMLEVDNLIKITLGNPKEIDPFLFSGFSNYKTGSTLNYVSYDPLQLADQYLIDLYIGQDISGYYLNFFQVNDVGITEENVLSFRPIVLIYAGWYRSNIIQNPIFIPTKFAFQNYLKTSIFEGSNGSKYRHSQFLQALISKFKNLRVYENNNRILIKDGYNDKQLKVELYNYFKSFNDKWVAGNSLGQRSLLEEFLFLDKANRDIGDKVYLNISKLVDIANPKNDKQNLYGALGQLIAGTGFDMRALPAYVNFYGSNFSNKTKTTPSQKLADNLFGTFLDVDYQESMPKVVVQYITSPTSKYLDMRTSKSYKFSDDSFNVGNTANNPLVITTPEIFTSDKLSKSNKVVAFEVSMGDQNQNIFKGIQLDQTTLKNTTESFVVLENLGRSESGAGTYNVDIGLFDYYRQASYACEINCMGNAMIQPTMYFYLKNVPMFKGSYWITEVSHSISNNNMNTTFKGTRIPVLQIPDTKDSFTASYRTLFDKILSSALIKQETERKLAETTKTITTNSGTFKTTLVKDLLTTEELVNDSGVDQYGIPFNGAENEMFIQKVKNKDITDYDFYYRAIAVEMGTNSYPISDQTVMSLINQIPSIGPIKWGDIKDNNLKIYSTKFKLSTNIKAENITATNRQTIFVNPNSRPYKKVELSHQVSFSNLAGPVNIGPAISGYGIGLTKQLMTELGLYNGDIVYFRIV